MADKVVDTTAPVAPYLLASKSFKVLVDPQVTFTTSLGEVVFEFDPMKAPITVANMLDYVHDGFYNGTLFHRVIPGFMVQGGGLTSGMVYKPPTYDPILLESANGLSNLRGALAMARTPAPDSATSQFFVNLVDNTGLDYVNSSSPGYAVFGKVVTGMAVIDSIASVPTATVNPYANVPQTEVVITSAAETKIGSSISNTGVVAVGSLEKGAAWEYSTNGGITWVKGKGSSFALAEGSYAERAIEVRQTDKAGNLSAHVGKSVGTLTVDKTAPAVASFSPVNVANGVGVSDNIVLSFNEGIQLGTGSIVLKTSAGKVVETYSVTPGSATSTALTINPTQDFSYGVGYKFEISPGSVVDVAGNKYAGTKSYKFTTTDTLLTSDVSYTLTTLVNKLTYAGTGNFTGTGNDAANVITGGSGADILAGGLGNDTLVGASGSDTFVFDTALGKKNIDIIADFASGDRIQLDHALFGKFSAGVAIAGNFHAGSAAASATDYIVYDVKGNLYYDADGNGASKAVQFATLTGHPTINAMDFVVI